MSRTRTRIRATTTGSALLAAVAGAQAAAASDFTIELPGGTACAFPLRVDGSSGNTITRTFTDDAGDTVRLLSTGTGSALTFTNQATGARLSLQSNGSVTRTTVLADGSTLNASTGHNVLVLFPTDAPAGPSTTLYTGQIVYTATPTGDFTLLDAQGTSRDLCAELT